jgi:putative endonuclease
VYILASGRHGTTYVGVTSNLLGRLYQHREKHSLGFTSQHDVVRLMWFEQHETMESAIVREKRIKKWNRDWKIRLIEEANPEWDDLALGFGFDPIRKC